MNAKDAQPAEGSPARRPTPASRRRQSSRRGQAGRRAGRPDTRAEILAAALSLFAERGYAGTSIRAVAAGARVDPALVHHYFGTKEGLFRATLDTPINPEELVGRIVDGDPAGAPRRLVETFFAVWDSPETGPAMVSFLRRVLADQQSATLFRDFMGATLLRTLAERLVEGSDHQVAAARVQLAVSQLVGLVIIRKVLGMEPLASLTSAQLTDAVTPSVARYLRGDSAELDLFAVVEPPPAPPAGGQQP
ncbi:TetR/AcrR family transcriptional regulator [Ornithinimicrobium cryptoxanthini]|uniref:TetR family transcriptional regulator n=1 Tax=Ornithinimicrobium cryptoxanthini TaxID=2934161 RepID=A0ABY4YGI1_9MICO|nr:TetR family transcriptional regulator [Ornithinimicrobium cryptoxanthini]USQ75881.1 TetR family transcriptional regulator [Ornithinimicrobium cryptoxanthini]